MGLESEHKASEAIRCMGRQQSWTAPRAAASTSQAAQLSRDIEDFKRLGR